jgi:hypothetical protein
MKDIIRMNQLAGLITEGQAKKMMEILNEELSDEQIITILKKYEDPESGFYKTNFSDYLIDIKDEDYEGTPQDFLTTEKKVISDYKKWKQSGY